MRNQKNKIMIVMLVVMVFMATGYAFFASYLNINAVGSITTNWNVYFSNVEKGAVIGGAKDRTTPKLTATTAVIDVDLALPGDSITYNITLTNGGSVNAIIEDIKAIGEGTDAIIYTISGLKIGDKLAGGASKVLSIKIEYDNNVTSQPTETYKRVTINIDAVQDIGQTITVKEPVISTKLSSKILSTNVAYATNVASPYVTASTGIDFSKSSSDTNGKGLYMANDDNGVSYFFRGNVENNYVKFGGGFTEKVTETVTKYYVATYLEGYRDIGYERFETESECVDSDEYMDSVDECYCHYIEEEGKYAVVFVYGISEYYGDTGYDSHEECEASEEFQEPIYDDIGEPYYEKWCEEREVEEEVERTVPPIIWRIVRINGDGSIRLIVDFNDTNLNYYVTTSDEYEDYPYAKSEVESWYTSSLEDNSLNYLEDTTFCVDRSGETYNDEEGYTYYGAHSRLYGNNVQPILTCSSPEDRLTVANGALNYPVGLITADEVVLAGEGSYLSYESDEGDGYITMTPSHIDEIGHIFYVEQSGGLNSTSGIGGGVYPHIRPVINLKANTYVTGSGTKIDPYVVQTN